MPDVFLSYNREDQAVARRFAEAFQREGLNVWWDVTLRSGEEYDKVTEQALSEAMAVVVLWSPHSVDSRWVRAEATQALRNGTLIPAMIGDCKRPIMFELTHTADLARWQGNPDDKAWTAFLSDVRRLVEKNGLAPPSPPHSAPQQAAAAQTSRRGPLVIGVALAVLAVAAIAVATTMRPQAGAAAEGQIQRTAFFGFNADGNDTIASAMAASATGETYDTLSALGLETASASETQNIERPAQLARAKELGARYALGGDVRRDGDQFSVAIRLEDVESRTTLLQDTLTGDISQKVSLPVRAAARASNALRCYIGARTGLRPLLRTENDEIMRAMSRVCAVSDGPFIEQAEARRELARLAPDSVGVQTNLALWLFLAMGFVPPADQPPMRQEIDTALKATLAIDPRNGIARAIQADFSIADGHDLAEAEKLLRAALHDDPNLFFLNIRQGIFLRSVGRYQAALIPLETSVRLSPLQPNFRTVLAQTLATAGQPSGAEENYRYNDTRLPDDGTNWNSWIQAALFDHAGDPREILKRAPARVSGDTVACMKDIVDGVLLHNAKQRAAAAEQVIACSSQGSLRPISAIQPAAALGRLDDAFSLAKRAINKKAYTFDNSTVLFATAARPMRADPRFLPLVKELGIYQYWLDTKTHPDVCERPEEKGLPVCVELRAAQGGQ